MRTWPWRTLSVALALTFLLAPMGGLDRSPNADLDTSREEQYYQTSLQNIERFRKGWAHITVLDRATRQPLKGQGLSYKQTYPSFIHGFLYPWSVLLSKAEGERLWRELGAPWVFFMEGNRNWSWRRIEPERGVFDFSGAERDLADLKRRFSGVQVGVMLYGLLPNNKDLQEARRPNYVRTDQLKDPQVFQEYKEDVYRYVYNLVGHFRGRIRYWTTQNEANHPDWAKRDLNLPEVPYTLQQAVEINEVVVKAIRDANPESVVLLATSPPNRPGGAETEVGVDPLTFARMNLEAGVDFDAVSIQVYGFTGPPAWFYEYFDKFAALGKPLFVQEVGYPSQPLPQDFPWYQGWKVFTEDAQALWYKYIVTFLYGKGHGLGLLLLFYKDLPDTPINDPAFAYQGLLDVEERPKQSYQMYKQLIEDWTTEGAAVTDSAGSISFSGFAGDYRVFFSVDGISSEANLRIQEGNHHFYLLLRSSDGSVSLAEPERVYLPWVKRAHSSGEAR